MGTKRPGLHAAPSVRVTAGASGVHRQKYLSTTDHHKQGEVYIALLSTVNLSNSCWEHYFHFLLFFSVTCMSRKS